MRILSRLAVVLFVLLSLGASAEDCDMTGGPVRYPGAVQSRNSQQRNNALQAAAYSVMPQEMARFAVNFDEGFMQIGAGPGVLTPDTAYFARLKFRDRTDFVGRDVAVVFGSPGAAVTSGVAIYEYQPVVGGFDLALIDGQFITRSSGSPVWEFRLNNDILFDRNKTYVLGIVTDSTNVVALAYMQFAYTFGLASGYETGFATSKSHVTSTTGWPNKIFGRPGDVINELSYGVTVMNFGLVAAKGFKNGMVY